MKTNLNAAKYAAMMGVVDGLEVNVSVWNRDTRGYSARFIINDYSRVSAIEAHCELYEADVWEISYSPDSVDITLLDGGFEAMLKGL